MHYLFNFQTLMQINKLVSSPLLSLGKRTIVLDDQDATDSNLGVSPAKKAPAVVRKIQHMIDERLSKSQE
jgi:hypothetical protein